MKIVAVNGGPRRNYNTFQFNDRLTLNEAFRSPAEEKKKHREEQFPKDLELAFSAGERMANKIQNI